MFKVQHNAYCGMSDVPACFDTHEEAHAYAASRIARYRRHFAVTTLETGQAWEIQEPVDCAMVPDACGLLTLSHQTFECRECGSACETQHDALHCCSEADA
jgi:hypothetical protein